MEERYPYLRFVIESAQVVAGVIAAVVLLGGIAESCRVGGFGGFVQLVITVVIAVVAYVATMMWVEVARVFLDIEDNTRRLVDEARERRSSGPSSPSS